MRDVLCGIRRAHVRRRSAFTLIELLVVLAILGLLLAILIPSFVRVKEKSRRVVCQNNLHQFSIGLLAYAGANRQMLLPGRAEFSAYEHTPVLARKIRRELLKYVGHPKVLECPWLGRPFENSGGWYYPGQGYVLGYNYLGGHLGTPWAGPPGFEPWVSPQSTTQMTAVPLLTELNAWTPGEHRTWAPHGARGPITEYGEEGKGGMTSVQAGAAGGNLCMLDGSVFWKGIANMKFRHGSRSHLDGCRTMW
jgi:prepilin-type N-terminal cleavage/methylation domain-containing protein